MMPMFVQTGRHVIDIAKIAFVETYHQRAVTIVFTDKAKLSLPENEAAVLLEAIAVLATRRAVLAMRAPAEVKL